MGLGVLLTVGTALFVAGEFSLVSVDRHAVGLANMMWSTDPWLNDGGGDGILIQGDNNEVSYNHISGSLACSRRYIYDGSAVELIGAANNRIHHNSFTGILFEISNGASIFGNAAWENGYSYPYYGGGAGITVESSGNADVHDNTVAWNATGICVISDDRGSYPHVGNYVHNNTVVMGRESYGLGWFGDPSNIQFQSTSNNRGANDVYWFPSPENSNIRYDWKGGTSSTRFSIDSGIL